MEHKEINIPTGYEFSHVEGDKVVLKAITPIEIPSDGQTIALKDAFKFTEWMSNPIQSNYKSSGNWFVNGGLRTTEQLYKEWLKGKGSNEQQ